MELSQEDIDSFIDSGVQDDGEQKKPEQVSGSLTQDDVDSFQKSFTQEADKVSLAKENLSISYGNDADKAAETHKKNKELGFTGFSEPAIEEAYKNKKRTELRDSLDQEKNPKTVEFLSDKSNAEVAWDDTDALKVLEDEWGYIKKDFSDPFQAAQDALVSLALGVPDLITSFVGGAEFAADVHAAGFENLIDLYGLKDTTFGEAVKKYNPAAGYSKLAGTVRKELSEFREQATPETDSFALGAVHSGLSSATASGITVIGAASAGAPHVALPLMGLAAFGSAAGKGKDQGMSLTDRFIYATSQGAVEVVAEKLGLREIQDTYKKLKGVIPDIDIKQTILKGMAKEQIGEQIATHAGDFIDFLMLPENEGKDASEYIKTRPAATLQTIIATGVATPVQHGGAAVAGYGQRKAEQFSTAGQVKKEDARYQVAEKELKNVFTSENDQKKIDKVIELSQSGILTSRDPERKNKFIESLGGKELYVYVPSDVVADIPDLPEYMKTDFDSLGVDIEIPLSIFMSKVATNEQLLTAIRPHIKMREDGYSMDEIERNGDNAIKQVLEAANEAAKTSQRYNEMYEDLRQGFKDTDVVDDSYASMSAKLLMVEVRTRAATTGESLEESFARVKTSFVGPDQSIDSDATQIDQDPIATAKKEGYEGEDIGESKEWVAATKKFGKEGMTKEARMARAKEAGFDADNVMYHGTYDVTNMEGIDIKEFQSGSWFTKSSGRANQFTKEIDPRFQTGSTPYAETSQVIPVFLKKPSVDTRTESGAQLYEQFLADTGMSNRLNEKSLMPYTQEFEFSKWHNEKFGKKPDSIIVDEDGTGESVRVYNSSNIRSINAAFDPDYKDSANLLMQGDNEPSSKEVSLVKKALPSKETEVALNHAKESINTVIKQWATAFKIEGGEIGTVQGERAKAELYRAESGKRNLFIVAEEAFTTPEEGRLEQEKLVQAAKDNGFFFEYNHPLFKALSSSEYSGGNEHVVYLAQGEDADVIIRLTKNGEFGHGSKHSPAKYLKRLEDFNKTFPDYPVLFMGVTQSEDGALAMLTAQPFVDGKRFDDNKQLDAALRKNGWYPVTGAQETYKHHETNAVVTDVNFRNVLYGAGDKLYFIDVAVTELPKQPTNITTPEELADKLSPSKERETSQLQKKLSQVEALSNCLKKG